MYKSGYMSKRAVRDLLAVKEGTIDYLSKQVDDLQAKNLELQARLDSSSPELVETN